MPQNNINENSNGRESKRDSSPNAATNAAASNASNASKKSNRGFASMDSSKQREIASKGGRAAHQKGTAHQFTPDEAREAGRKGGGTVSQDRTHMAEIGRIGGQSRGRRMARGGTSGSEAPPASQTIESAAKVDSSDDESERETIVNDVPAKATGEYRH